MDEVSIIVVILIAAAVCLPVLIHWLKPWQNKFRNKHVVIPGGSEGLGKALAIHLVELGAQVTILSRNQNKLQAVMDLVNESNSPLKGKLSVVVADVTNPQDISNAMAQLGHIDVLIPCAGASLTGKWTERSLNDHRQAMDLNYFGTVHCIHAVLPQMIQRKSGIVCLIGSALSLTSYIGYAAYSPTKYALRGLADTLRNELLPYNISMHIAYPGNMQTAGFDCEQETKPAETKSIESSGSVYLPREVAKSVLKSIGRGEYNIYCGAPDVMLLGVLANGLSPRVYPILDLMFWPIAMAISPLIRFIWDKRVMY